MDRDLALFQDAFARGGLIAGLRVLSGRTSFRFTGVYRFKDAGSTGGDAATLENVALVDRQDPSVTSGPSVPLSDAYCDYFGAHGDELAFGDISRPDVLVARKANNPALSYCGVLIRTATGEPVGSLCFFDTRSCEPRPADLPLLRGAARIIAPVLGQRPSPERE